MFLGLYLGTTAISWYSVFRFKKIMEQKLKDDGYKIIKKKHSLKEIVVGVFTIIALSVPLVNLMFPLTLTTKKEDYIAFRNKLLDEGSIVLVEESAKKRNNVIEVDESKLIQRINTNGHVYYSPMNRDDNDDYELSGRTYKKTL